MPIEDTSFLPGVDLTGFISVEWLKHEIGKRKAECEAEYEKERHSYDFRHTGHRMLGEIHAYEEVLKLL